MIGQLVKGRVSLGVETLIRQKCQIYEENKEDYVKVSEVAQMFSTEFAKMRK